MFAHFAFGIVTFGCLEACARGEWTERTNKCKYTNRYLCPETRFHKRTIDTDNSLTTSRLYRKTTDINMAEARGLRRKDPITYAISDDSDDDEGEGSVSPAFNSPAKRGRSAIDVEEDDDSESDETADEVIVVQQRKTPPPRSSAAGHSLRQHKDLHLSTRALENADRPRVKRRKVGTTKTRRKRAKTTTQQKAPPPIGPRKEVREAINTETAGRRARFFVDKAEYFLPLLPESNHVKKLLEQSSLTDFPAITEYEAIETQPAG